MGEHGQSGLELTLTELSELKMSKMSLGSVFETKASGAQHKAREARQKTDTLEYRSRKVHGGRDGPRFVSPWCKHER